MNWIYNRKEERGDIHKYYKNAKSVISVALNYYTGRSQQGIESDFKFSNHAWGDDYHIVLKDKLFKLLKWAKKNNSDIEVVCTDIACYVKVCKYKNQTRVDW